MKKSKQDSQPRKLVLRREAIASLTATRLGQVHGGQTWTIFTSRVTDLCPPDPL